jgi:hypothetical protein
MTESVICFASRSLLEEIRLLKLTHDSAYELASISKLSDDIKRVRKLRDNFSKKVEVLSLKNWTVEAERHFQLREQYDIQIDRMLEFEFIRKETRRDAQDGSLREVVYLEDADGVKYEVPSYKGIIKHTHEKRDLLRLKADQGFTIPLLIPFGMSLEKMVACFRKYLATTGDVSRFSQQPIWLARNQTVNKALDENGDEILLHAGVDEQGPWQKKRDILERQLGSAAWDAGWKMVFLQASAVKTGIENASPEQLGVRGKERSRKEPPLGASGYLRSWLLEVQKDTESPYIGERGYTLETWLMACMYNLEMTGEMMDDLLRFVACVGSRLMNPADGDAVAVRYSSELQQVIVKRNANGEEGVFRLRTEVRI